MAKNISSFSPGMSSSSEMLDYCEFIFRTTMGPGDTRSHDYGNGCGVYCYQTNHAYAGEVLVRMFGSGGGTGGACCCMTGSPAGSGPYAIFNATPKTGCRLCWHVSSGGCCVASNTGNPSECYQWIKDEQKDASGRIFLPGGYCSCTICNGPACERNWHVCYQANLESTEYECTGGKHVDGDWPRYHCRSCFVNDGGTNVWLDSDINLFPSRMGFTATGKCNNTGGSICRSVQFSNMPAYAAGKREYFMSQSMSGENCYGGWLTSCQACFWWGSPMREQNQKNQHSLCGSGAPGIAPTANGGNCYCGGNGQAGTAISIYYKLSSAITG